MPQSTIIVNVLIHCMSTLFVHISFYNYAMLASEMCPHSMINHSRQLPHVPTAQDFVIPNSSTDLPIPCIYMSSYGNIFVSLLKQKN